MKNKTLAAFAFFLMLSFPTHADNWSFQLEPYLMAINIEGDASMGRVSGVPVDIDYKDILEHLDMAAMLHFEALHKSGWGLIMDYAFMDVSMKNSNSRDGFLKVSMRQGILETFGFYRVKHGKTEVDYLTGVRWWDNDSSLSLDFAIFPGSIEVQVQEDWLDLVVGVRVTTEVNENWSFSARADVGGFGLTANFTSTIETGLVYQISKLMVLDLKYKATWVDYDNEYSVGSVGYFQYDAVIHGPILGLSFNF